MALREMKNKKGEVGREVRAHTKNMLSEKLKEHRLKEKPSAVTTADEEH